MKREAEGRKQKAGEQGSKGAGETGDRRSKGHGPSGVVARNV